MSHQSRKDLETKKQKYMKPLSFVAETDAIKPIASNLLLQNSGQSDRALPGGIGGDPPDHVPEQLANSPEILARLPSHSPSPLFARLPSRSASPEIFARMSSQSASPEIFARMSSRPESPELFARMPSRPESPEVLARTPSPSDTPEIFARLPSRSGSLEVFARMPSEPGSPKILAMPSRSESPEIFARLPSRSESPEIFARLPSQHESPELFARLPSRSPDMFGKETRVQQSIAAVPLPDAAMPADLSPPPPPLPRLSQLVANSPLRMVNALYYMLKNHQGPVPSISSLFRDVSSVEFDVPAVQEAVEDPPLQFIYKQEDLQILHNHILEHPSLGPHVSPVTYLKNLDSLKKRRSDQLALELATLQGFLEVEEAIDAARVALKDITDL